MNSKNWFGFSGNKGLFSSLGKDLDNGLFIYCLAIGTVLFGIGTADYSNFNFNNDWQACHSLGCALLLIKSLFTCLVFGALLVLIGSFGTFFDQKKLSNDLTELKDAKRLLNSTQEDLDDAKSRLSKLQKSLVETWLQGVSSSLKLKHDSRITIYYENEGEFYLLARYSPNPSFATIHRQKFALNQGVISKAWQTGEHIENICPHSGELVEYKSHLKKHYDYEPEKVESLNMKSCRYYAKAIIDASHHIGVIVFESIEINFFSGKKSQNIASYCNENQSQMSKFVRDSLSFDKEINNTLSNNKYVEADLLAMVEGKNG